MQGHFHLLLERLQQYAQLFAGEHFFIVPQQQGQHAAQRQLGFAQH